MKDLGLVSKTDIVDLIDELTLIKVEVIDKLESLQDSNLLETAKDFEQFKKDYLTQINSLQNNYIKISENLKVSNSLELEQHLDDMFTKLYQIIKTESYSNFKDNYGEIIASSFISNLESNRDYKKTIDAVNKFNKDIYKELSETSLGLASNMGKAIELFKEQNLEIKKSKHSIQDINQYLNVRLIDELAFKSKFFSFTVGTCFGGASTALGIYMYSVFS